MQRNLSKPDSRTQDLATMFLPRLNWKFVDRGIKKLDRAVAAADNDLVPVGFRPSIIEERILVINLLTSTNTPVSAHDNGLGRAPFLWLDAVGTEA